MKKKNNNIYCVYMHIRPDKNEPFYIGIGKIERPYILKRNKIWKNIVNKNLGQYKIVILYKNKSRDFCCEKEKELIYVYGRKINNSGCLSNIDPGADKGASFTKNITEDVKEKIRKTLTGIKHSEERKQNQRNAHKNRSFEKETERRNKIIEKLNSKTEDEKTEIINKFKRTLSLKDENNLNLQKQRQSLAKQNMTDEEKKNWKLKLSIVNSKFIYQVFKDNILINEFYGTYELSKELKIPNTIYQLFKKSEVDEPERYGYKFKRMLNKQYKFHKI